MLKTRIITACILIPLVIIGILFLPPLTFFFFAMLFILLAGWEWSALAGFTHFASRIIFLALLAAISLLAIVIPLYLVIVLGLLWWITASILLILYPKGTPTFAKSKWIRSIMGFFVLIPSWIGLIILQGFSPILLIYCLILIWGVDSTAYIIGKKWGNYKLAPTISPGKSYEGLLSGILMATIISAISLLVLDVPAEHWLLFFIICIVGGGLITVLGDLFESMIKRQSHVKDSGRLLPGHGGILDRIDSMTTAIPFFALVFPYFFNQ
jgi:phosphatidate cytidylyltransferase